jgi:hypothetical protein
MADTVVVLVILALVFVEIILFILHRRRQRQLRAKDLAQVPSLDVWYLPQGWTASSTSPHVHPVIANGSLDPTESLSVPQPSARHISAHLRTRGYVVLGVVEKWRGLPPPEEETLPRYEALNNSNRNATSMPHERCHTDSSPV